MGFVPINDDLATLRTPLGPGEPPPGPRRIERDESSFMPAWRTQNVIGSGYAAETYPGKYSPNSGRVLHPEVAHDPLDLIRGTKYDQYRDAFIGSESAAETRARMRQIDRENKDREALDNAGWPGIVAQVAAGTIDPTIIMPGGSLVRSAKGGYALAKSMASVGISGAAAVTAQEAALHGTQFTRTMEESIGNVAAATILAGLLGAGASRFATAAERAAGIKALDQIKSELTQRGPDGGATGLTAPAGAAASDTRQLLPTEMVPAFVGRAYDRSRALLARAGELPGVRAIPGVRTAVGLAGKAASAVLGVPEWLIKRSGPLTRMAYSGSTAGKRAMADLVESPIEFLDNKAGVPTARNGPAVETTARIAIDGARWKLTQELDRLFGDYYFGGAKRLGKVKAKIDEIRGTGDGRMTFKEFKGAVRDAMINGDTHPVPEVQAAARWLRKEVFDPWKEAAIRLKLLPEDVTVKTAESYFMRVYNKQKIVAQRPDFTERITRWLTDDQATKAQMKADLQRNRDLRAERTKALRKLERRLETIQRRQDEVEARLGERDIEVRQATKRVDAIKDRQSTITDELTDLDEVIRDLKDTVKNPELKAELQQLERELSGLKRADKPVTLEDLERLDKEEAAGILTGPLRRAARIASGQAKGPKPPSFVAYIAKEGGIKDTGGDVLATVGDKKKAPGLIRADAARDLDAWGEKLTQDFPEVFVDRPSPDNILELIAPSIIGDQPQWFIQAKMSTEDLEVMDMANMLQFAAERAGIKLNSPADVAELFRTRDPRDLADLEDQINGMTEDDPWSYASQMRRSIEEDRANPDRAAESREAAAAYDDEVRRTGQDRFAIGREITARPGTDNYIHLGQFEPRNPENIGVEAAQYVIEQGKRVGGEAMLMFDAQGNVVADGTGKARNVAWPAEAAEAFVTPGAGLIAHHNHPSSTSLSSADIGYLAYPGLSVVWAHGNNGRWAYRASLPPALRDADPLEIVRAIRGAHRGVDNGLASYIQPLIDQKKITFAEANELHRHFISQALHNAGLIDYFTTYTPPVVAGVDFSSILKAATRGTTVARELHFDAATRAAVAATADSPDRLARTIRHPGEVGISSPFGGVPARERPIEGVVAGRGPGSDQAQARPAPGRARLAPPRRRPEQLRLPGLAEREALHASPEFKNWFGDSKVVDEKGEPLVVYHGGPAKTIDQFRPEKIGTANDTGFYGRGFYFTGSRELAEDYRPDARGRREGQRLGAVQEVYLKIEKPFIWDLSTPELQDDTLRRIREIMPDANVTTTGIGPRNGDYRAASKAKAATDWTEALKAEGYDGVIIETKAIYPSPHEIVVFEPTQIKSVFNKGEFDPSNPNMLAEDASAFSAVRRDMEEVRDLAKANGGTIFVRWSRGPEFDMAPGAASRDYQTGARHAGLSAVPITADMNDGRIFRMLRDYGYFRGGKNEGASAHLYAGKVVGKDSDGADSIRPTKFLKTLRNDTIDMLDKDVELERIEVEDALKMERNGLEKHTPEKGFISPFSEETAKRLEDRLAQLSGMDETAYHGSPYRGFDRFSTDNIGSGEGAQAFGWGLYFASEKKIAEHYRKKLSGDGMEVSVGGVPSEEIFANAPDKYTYNGIFTIMEQGGIDNAIAWLKKDSAVPGRIQRSIDYNDKVIEWIEANRENIKVHDRKGGLYAVDIPDSKEMLDWSAGLADQPEDVKAKIDEIGKKYLPDEIMIDGKPMLAWELKLHNAARKYFTKDPPAEGLELLREFLLKARNRDEAINAWRVVGPQWLKKDMKPVIEELARADVKFEPFDVGNLGHLTGEQFYRHLSGRAGGDEAASEILKEAGIPGHRYPDSGSRAPGSKRSDNFVIYDDTRVNITGMEEDERALPAYRDPTIPIRLQREGMEQTINVRRENVANLKREIEKFKGFRQTAENKAGREGARGSEAELRLRNSIGGTTKKDGTVTRGRRGVLQDRSSRLDTARELMDRARSNVQSDIDDLRLAAEEKLLQWEGKSAGDAKAALKRRDEAARIRDLKKEAGVYNGKDERLTGADKAVDAAIKRIIRSDRDKMPEELESLANEIVDRIIGSPDGRLPYDLPTGGPKVGPPSDGPPPRGPLAHREFMIPDEDIKDWLVDDVEQVAHTYLGSIVPDVLLTERFGDVDMTQTFRQINEEYNAKVKASTSEDERLALRNEQERVIGDLAAMRDRLRGTYGITSDTVMRNAARIAGAAGSLNTLADMGGSAISQLPDLAGPIFRHGFGTTFRDGWMPFFKNLSQGNKGAMAKAKRQYNAMGIAIDMVHNTRNLDEVGEQYHPRTQGERMLKGGAQAFMNVNLSAPMTDMAKTIAAVISGNEIFRATKAVAEGKARPRQITDLAAASIDEEMAGRIWKSFQESGAVEDGVFLPNTADWSDAGARRAFEGAVSREANIAVVTPGQEKALWLSNPVLKILGQFKAFIASSSVRIMAANLQRRDAQTLQGLIGSIALAMLGYKAYTVATGQEASDRWEDWVKEGTSRAGVLGWIDEGNSFASKFTRGQLDLYRAVGADKPLTRYASRGVLGALLGPTAGKIENAAQAAGALASGDFAAADTRATRRLMPLQNLFYIRRLLNQVEDGFNERFGIPARKQ